MQQNILHSYSTNLDHPVIKARPAFSTEGWIS